jgi:lipid II:glycine glycyltransferase (peptidoglycan interpeptide bridge formation enzyme)
MQINSFLTGKRIVSLPFSDFCEPLYSSILQADEIVSEIFSYAKNQKLEYVEFRSSETKFPLQSENYRSDLRHILFLDKSENETFKSFSENTRRNIKKTAKSNVVVVIKNDIDGLNFFYEMFCVTRQKHGLPPQPIKFFKNIFEYIIKKGRGDIVLAKHNNQFIAGAVYFKFGEKILYKFGASYPVFNDLKGNNAVMWFAIQKYINEKYKEFDFGRTEINHEGLRRFKLSWNTEERFIYTSKYDIKTSQYHSVKIKTEGFYNRIFNRTPVWALKLISKILYKHIG